MLCFISPSHPESVVMTVRRYSIFQLLADAKSERWTGKTAKMNTQMNK